MRDKSGSEFRLIWLETSKYILQGIEEVYVLQWFYNSNTEADKLSGLRVFKMSEHYWCPKNWIVA